MLSKKQDERRKFVKIDAIREKMAQRGIKSMNELERRADLGLNTVYRWPEKSPSIDKVFRVARVLGCTVDELIAEPDAPNGCGTEVYFRSVKDDGIAAC